VTATDAPAPAPSSPPPSWRERARAAGPQALAKVEAARGRFRAVDAAWDLWDRDRRKAATLLAGALVYRLFVWLLPVTLLAVSLLGFLGDFGTDSPEEVARQTGVGGYMVGVVADAADQAQGSRWFTLALALFGIAVTGNGTVRALRLSHALVWDVELTRLKRSWTGPVAMFGMTLLIGALAALSWKARDLGDGVEVGTILLSGVPIAAAWLLGSWLLPHDGAPWWALLPGALLGAAGVLVMHLVTVFYLAGKIESASKMYGSLGAAAAVLLWLSIFARLIIIGAGLNATLWYRRTARRPGGRRRRQRQEPPPAGATLSVWKFPTPGGADAAERTLLDLQRQGLITVHDAATVSWPEDVRQPRTVQLQSLTEAGALSGSFWGLLFGVLFVVPVLGVAVGTAAGALVGALTDVGIDDDFIRSVRAEVTPGTSALFLLSSDAVLDKVVPAFETLQPRLVRTNLSADQDAWLREVFRASRPHPADFTPGG
jgi:uncharacterized membrane protein/uncharacterized BrkB/YihY/UPF0761 family membrane protein